jgi:hypothetical protein
VSSILIIYSRLQPFYARWIFLPRFLILEILTPNLVSKVSNYFNNTNDSKLLINKNKNRGKHLFSPDTIVTHTIVPFWGDRESICKFALMNYCVSGSGSITAPCAQLLEVGCISVKGSTSVRGYIYKGLGLGLRGCKQYGFFAIFDLWLQVLHCCRIDGSDSLSSEKWVELIN